MRNLPASKKRRYVIGVLGMTGYGKTEFVKSLLPRINRYIVFDPQHEYPGLVLDSAAAVGRHVAECGMLPFSIAYRPRSDADAAAFFRLAAAIRFYTLILEEAEEVANTNRIDEYVARIVSYGRHDAISLIWVSRQPKELSAKLRRQSETVVSFRLSDPLDLEWCRKRGFEPAAIEEIAGLDRGSYRMQGNFHLGNIV